MHKKRHQPEESKELWARKLGEKKGEDNGPKGALVSKKATDID